MSFPSCVNMMYIYIMNSLLAVVLEIFGVLVNAYCVAEYFCNGVDDVLNTVRKPMKNDDAEQINK